jgi:hypothetical protein
MFDFNTSVPLFTPLRDSTRNSINIITTTIIVAKTGHGPHFPN